MIRLDIHKELHGAQGKIALEVKRSIGKGELIALMGESGTGKTSLLRIIAGLDSTQGDVVVDGMSCKEIASQKREIGFVFQDYALFDNMSVEENLLFVNDDRTFASELLEMTELSTLKARNVKGLSGGQKQRVSLCRALIKKPKILLMDEPLSALDARMRAKLQDEILALHHRLGMTTIMVSHDINEVFKMASRVWVLQKGEIVKDGTVNEVMKNETQDALKLEADVLSIDKKNNTYFAIVHSMGKVLEVEVDAEIEAGDTLKLSLQVVN